MCRRAQALQKVTVLPDGHSDPDRDKLFIGNRSCKRTPFLPRETQAAALENVIDGTKRAQVLETEPGSEIETDHKDGHCLETGTHCRGPVLHTGKALPTGSVSRQKGPGKDPRQALWTGQAVHAGQFPQSKPVSCSGR